MVYPVVVYGSPVLKKVAAEIDEDFPGLDKLIQDMFDTMNAAEGIGLAAPQIGKSVRLFIVDAEVMAEDDPTLKGFKKVFINPQILEESGKNWNYAEGCLSIPDIREEVSRPSVVKIGYYDTEFNYQEEEYDGIKARIIQHEYDHLDGLLFVEKLSALKKKLLKGKLNAIAKGKVRAHYKTKVAK